MRVEQSQQNTHDSNRLIIAEKPKRKNPRRKLNLTTKRYSRRRIALRRKRELAAQKERAASNEEQCKIENEFSEEENFKTEQDFAAYIDLVFDVLDEKEIEKKPDAKLEGNEECLLSQESSNVSEVKQENPAIDSWKVEETLYVQQKIASDDEEYYVMEREVKCDQQEEPCRTDTVSNVDMQHVFTQIKAVENHFKSLDTELENEKAAIDPWKVGEMQYEQQKIESYNGDYNVVKDVVNSNSQKKRYSTDALSIVDMQHVFNQIKALDNHSASMVCSTKHLQVANVKRSGLRTTLVLECTMCPYKTEIHSLSSDPKRMNINQSAVAGTIISGGGYAQMEQFLAALNVPCMPANTYRKCHDNIVDALIRAAEIEMVAAAEEEKQLAIARGDVLPSGIPHIPVVADGSWIKRSYGTGRFDSPSGVGIIIGYHSKKVLFVGVRNKHCSICRSAKKRDINPRQHKCFKKWGQNQASAKMESDAILEGFKTSITTRGLIYSTLIADGDSSMYKKILDCDPYQSMVRVKKIECTNHLLRNFCKKMRDVVKKTPPGKYRRAVESGICRMKTAILNAAKFRFKEKLQTSEQVENLCGDIINVPSHVFGEHKECQNIGYFCNGTMQEDEQNIVPELLRLGVYQRIQEILRPLLSHAESLLYNRTNNSVESFNAIIAKYTGGKRLNFSQRGSYLARCSAAVIQYNTKEVLSCLNRAMRKEPSSVLLDTERRRKKEYMQNVLRRQRSKNQRHVRKLFCSEDDPDYGPNAVKPEIEELAVELRTEQIDDTSDRTQSDKQKSESNELKSPSSSRRESPSSLRHEVVIKCVGDVE